jgi:hypothetical protein
MPDGTADIRADDEDWEAGAGHWDNGAGAGEAPEPISGGYFCAHSAVSDHPQFRQPGSTDAARDQVIAYAVAKSSHGQDYIIRHHDTDWSLLGRQIRLTGDPGDPDPGQIIATASGGQLRWGPRTRYYCVYAHPERNACYQAAGGTDADRDRAVGEATERSRQSRRDYIILEHDGDQTRTVGTARRGTMHWDAEPADAW